jgi:hypothetical protein
MKSSIHHSAWRSTVLFVFIACAALLFSMACNLLAPETGGIATTVAEVQEVATAVSELEELAIAVEEEPEATATTLLLPGPEVNFSRKFHYASLEFTLLGWQMIGDTTPEGISCESLFGDVHLAMRVHVANSADRSFTLSSSLLQVVDASNRPLPVLSEGAVFPTSAGEFGHLEVPVKAQVEEILCTDIRPEVDPATLTLVLGDVDYVQVRIPLSPEGPEDLGGFVEGPLNQTVSFKGAEITLPKVIVTTGVWSNIQPQAKIGHRWLIIPTQVNNTGSPNLFIEENEIVLEIGDRVLGRELAFYDMYQPAPYGLKQGLTADGALLFLIPEDTQQATLHFKALRDGYTDDVLVPLNLPASP